MVKTPLDMINIHDTHQGDGGADPTQCRDVSRTPCACSRLSPMPGADAGEAETPAKADASGRSGGQARRSACNSKDQISAMQRKLDQMDRS